MGILDILGSLGGGGGESQYSDIPFGIRLALASQAAIAMDQGKMPGTEGLATMGAMRERAIERRREDAKTQKQQDMANRLADKIEATNPMYAAALRADPSLVDNYMQADLQSQQWKQQYGQQRADTLADTADSRKYGEGQLTKQQEYAAEQARIAREQQLADIADADRRARANWEHQYGIQRTDSKEDAATAAIAEIEKELRAETNWERRERLKAALDTQKQILVEEAKKKSSPEYIQNENLTKEMQGFREMFGPVQPGKSSVRPGVEIPGTGGITATGNFPEDFFSSKYKTDISPTGAARLQDSYNNFGDVGATYSKIIDDEQPKKTQVITDPNATIMDEGAKNFATKEGPSYIEFGNKATESAIGVNALEKLLAEAPQGWNVEAAVGSLLPGYSGPTDAFSSLIAQIVPTLHAPGSGSQSDLEFASLFTALPKLMNTPEGNRVILEAMKSKITLNQERSALASKILSGEINYVEGRKALAALEQKSILTPELDNMLKGKGVDLGATVGAKIGSSTPLTKSATDAGITQKEWDLSTPEERAVFQ